VEIVMDSPTSPLHQPIYQGSAPKPCNIHLSQIFKKIQTATCAILLLSFTLLVQSCGGGSGGSASTASTASTAIQDNTPEQGDVIVSITDAPGDFTKYAVDVLSIRLQKLNGDVVETLPLTTRIDFTQLTDLTEFLSIATVPAGIYQTVEMTLDYSNAEIMTEDINGDSVLASVVDSNGESIASLTVRVSLPNSGRIRIAAGIPAHVSLDFDLAASNEVDLGQGAPIVTVEPFLLVTPELERARDHRVRGILAAVDQSLMSVTLKVRPFRHFDGNFGRFTFFSDDNTIFEVDGRSFVGVEGLRAMAVLANSAPVVAAGQATDSGFVADTVLAGSSVPWSNIDVVRGIVSARNGDTLTVKGARVEFRDGTDIFRNTYRVTIGAGTVITAFNLDRGDLDNSSISVGQRIVASGEFVGDNALDATDGRVRMQVSQLTAEVVQDSPLAVNLFFLNAHNPELYDFSGTGSTSVQDADPGFYEIDTALLPLGSITQGDLVQIRGLVNNFAMAPADFNAQTVIDVDTDDRAAALRVSWNQLPGSSMPFTSLASERIDVDLNDARVALKLRGVPLTISNPQDGIALVPAAAGDGLYAVAVRGSGETQLFRDFTALVTQLGENIDSGKLLNRIGGHGRYNRSTNELSARRLSFEFIDPANTQ